MKKEIFRIENVIGNESDITNLNNMCFHIFKGEILALVPINGCGRENLIRLMCWNFPVKYGKVYVNEKLVNSHIYSDRTLNQVYVVDPKSRLIPDQTVLDNIYAFQNAGRRFYYNRSRARRQLQWHCENIGMDISPDIDACKLTALERIIVEFLRALEQGAKLIIINDIGGCISPVHLKILKNLMSTFAGRGISFLYICNNYEEIIDICDRLLFMKDGKDLKTFDHSAFERESFQEMIRSLLICPVYTQPPSAPVMLEIKGLRSSQIKELNFSVEAGKCMVIYDKNRSINSPFTDKPLIADEIILDGKQLSLRNLKNTLGKQILVISPSPVESMLTPSLSYMENLCLGLNKKIKSHFVSDRTMKSVREEYRRWIGDCIDSEDLYGLAPSDLYNLIYYRIHLLNPKAAVIFNPFKNTDIILRQHITSLISMLKKKGIALIVISVDINACMPIADELAVLESGRIAASYKPEEFPVINLL